mgnify:CR=1 FL=1
MVVCRREDGNADKQIEYKVSSDYRICRIRLVYCFIERDKAIKAMLEPVGWSPEINHISGHCIINKFTMNLAVLYMGSTI